MNRAKDMDEHTFQHELRQLKQRVSELSSSSSRVVSDDHNARMSTMMYSSPPSASQGLTSQGLTSQGLTSLDSDSFLEQLADLKRQLATMQSSLAIASPSSPHPAPSACHDEASNMATAPTAFWQLISRLTEDLRRINERVVGLEDGVEGLEERVDALEPRRFTPAGSEVGSSEVVVEGDVGEGTSSSPSSEEGGEAESEDDVSPKEVESLGSGETLMPESGKLSESDETLTSEQSDECEAEISVDDERRILVEAQIASIKINADQDSMVNGSSSQHGQPIHTSKARRMISHLESKIVALAAADAAGVPDEAITDDYLTFHTSASSAGPGSLAFRDKEIDRMDEMLRDAEEKIRAQEFTMLERDRQIEMLKTDREDVYSQLMAERSRNTWLCNDSKSKQIQHRELLRIKIAQLAEAEEAAQRYKSALSKQMTRYEQLHEGMDDMERDLVEMINQTRLAHRKTTQQRNEEMKRRKTCEENVKRLESYCEEKDGVIQQLQHLLARGQHMMVDRDDAIEHLTRDLEQCQKQKDATRAFCVKYHATTTKGNATSKDPEQNVNGDLIDDLRHNLDDLGPPCNPQKMPKTVHMQQPASDESKVDTAADSDKLEYKKPSVSDVSAAESRTQTFASLVDGQDAAVISSWTPKPIVDNRRLASEEKRALAWEASSAEPLQPRPVFGQVTPMRSPRWQRRSDSHAEPPVGETPTQIPAGDRHLNDEITPSLAGSRQPEMTQRSRGSREKQHHGRRRHFDNTIIPPLPAPVQSDRTASHADLRSAAAEMDRRAANGHRTLSKHASMMELPRRRLQAYIETEAETADERRDQS